MSNGRETLARTLWGEARGEGVRGMEAVACVVMNRVAVAHAHGGWYWWGGTVVDVCRAPRQFSCWNEEDSNRAKIKALQPGEPTYDVALRIAERAMAGAIPDPTGGATHYHARSIKTPKWAREMAMTATIGGHVFYKERGKDAAPVEETPI